MEATEIAIQLFEHVLETSYDDDVTWSMESSLDPETDYIKHDWSRPLHKRFLGYANEVKPMIDKYNMSIEDFLDFCRTCREM
jgi:hypothetical protein